MTREEALLLEGQCDTMMSKYTGRVCELKMTFSGRLQVIFKHYDEFVILDEEMKEMSFVKFYGFYQDFVHIRESVLKCINDNKETFELLIWRLR